MMRFIRKLNFALLLGHSVQGGSEYTRRLFSIAALEVILENLEIS